MTEFKTQYDKDVEEGWYAVVRWSISDVHSYREDNGLMEWTDEEATDWLGSIESDIQDRMVEEGWEVIGSTMNEEG